MPRDELTKKIDDMYRREHVARLEEFSGCSRMEIVERVRELEQEVKELKMQLQQSKQNP